MPRKFPRDALVLLSSINKLRPRYRPILLAHLDDSGIDAISGLIFNLLYNRKVKYPPRKKKQIRALLKKRIDAYRKLAEKRRTYAEKRRLIKQHGGFLPALIGAAVPLIAQLIGNA